MGAVAFAAAHRQRFCPLFARLFGQQGAARVDENLSGEHPPRQTFSVVLWSGVFSLEFMGSSGASDVLATGAFARLRG